LSNADFDRGAGIPENRLTSLVADMSSDARFPAERVLRPREQVERQIRAAIYAGHFAPGERLPKESELAAIFSVSRPTVREALRSLAVGGLIYTVPGAKGGSFVTSIDHESLGEVVQESMGALLGLRALTLGELTQVRLLLEVPSARLAAELRSDEQVTILKTIVETQHDPSLSDHRIAQLDYSFHGTIADASGNRVLAAFITALHRVTHPVAFLSITDEVKRKTVVQHHKIVDAIERRDTEDAAEQMRAHLEFVSAHSAPGEHDLAPAVGVLGTKRAAARAPATAPRRRAARSAKQSDKLS
jgi:DNA-binding FadR family transcriptional regulator